MSSVSYVTSSVLLIVPFISAAVIKSSISEDNVNYDKTYGQWLAVTFFFVLLLEIIRLLYREITFANIIEASRKFKVVKKKKFLDVNADTDEGYTFFYLLKVLVNIPGYIMSFIFFPKSGLSYYFGLLTLFSMLVGFSIAYLTLDGNGTENKRGAIGGTLGAVFFFYFVFRFSID